jgi:translation initiation factor 2 alpha subunit (eIF-2alpha)
MTIIRHFAAVLLAIAMLCADAAALAQTIYFEEAKITIDERAREAGYFRVRIQPEGGGAAIEATLQIDKRMRENEIAKGIAAVLEPVVGPNYEVDRDAGEYVKIRKTKRDVANFSIEIAFSAPGFAVILDN